MTQSLKMAVIIAYRDRASHLIEFLRVFPSIVNKDRELPIDYHIFVIEQANDRLFNKGKLFNAGFLLTKDDYDYFCFHDVDMMPVSVDYSYPNVPTHLAATISQFQEKQGLPYPTYFGGAILLNKKDFITINGFSNHYEGWGAEDDDLLFRILMKHQMLFERRPGVFESLPHPPSKSAETLSKNRERFIHIYKNELIDDSGLSDLDFILKDSKTYQKPNYTKYLIDWPMQREP